MLTVGYNCMCMVQVVLVIADNLNFEMVVNRNIGLCLGVIFILWTFGLGLSLYTYLTGDD